jgi:hypothetical protein
MNAWYMLFNASRRVAEGESLLAAIACLLLLTCFVFCGLLSVWSLSNSSGSVQAISYSASTALFFGLAGHFLPRIIDAALLSPATMVAWSETRLPSGRATDDGSSMPGSNSSYTSFNSVGGKAFAVRKKKNNHLSRP